MMWRTVERPGYLGKLRDEVKGQWWRDSTIEDFYQKNKVLQVVDS